MVRCTKPSDICMKKILMLVLTVAGGAGFIAEAATSDSNFRETTYTTVGDRVTGMAWAPDGSNRLFISRQTGQVQVVANGVLVSTPFATVSPVYTANECGLDGICLDPNFMQNGYVYLFVTVSGSQQQIIRYTASGNVGINKTVIVPNLPTTGQNHNGGGIGVGPDGKLYWAIGDIGNSVGVDADLTSLAAKVGRANLDGSLPTGNPFADGAGANNDYIWARGLRNPFTMAFQPSTGALWVNSVGTSYEQVFLINAGGHAGYNDYENNQPAGYITPKIKYRTNGTDVRNITPSTGASRVNNVVTFTTTGTHGFRQGEKISIAGVSAGGFNGGIFVATVPSATTFTANQTGANTTSGGGTATTLNQGNCISGGCFYDATVPTAYRGNFIYGDFGSGRLMRATLGAGNAVQTVDYFVTGSGSQIDVSVGPDSALYYVEHGGEIHQLAYTNFTSQQILAVPLNVRMTEAGRTVLSVRLATPPAANVTVNTASTAGSADISIASGATLTFTPANYATPQNVVIQAAADADPAEDIATLTISSSGLASEAITVYAADTGASAAPADLTLGNVTINSGTVRVGLNGQPGETYVLEGSTNLLFPWTSVSTNTLTGSFSNILDPSGNLPLRFYRARLVP
jgi:glucose/arabinose dehydrogenase